jgi:taurine--2-oxoglutarate transaminase
LLQDLQRHHPSVGTTRNIGLFGVVELVRSRDPYVPLSRYNETSPIVAALDKRLKADGLYTMNHWNTFFTNPPLCITEKQLRDAFSIIDAALEETDAAIG